MSVYRSAVMPWNWVTSCIIHVQLLRPSRKSSFNTDRIPLATYLVVFPQIYIFVHKRFIRRVKRERSVAVLHKVPINHHCTPWFAAHDTCLMSVLCSQHRFTFQSIYCTFFLQVIFAELFQLPVPPHTEVMYTTLLIELCKLQPGSLPQVVSFRKDPCTS